MWAKSRELVAGVISPYLWNIGKEQNHATLLSISTKKHWVLQLCQALHWLLEAEVAQTQSLILRCFWTGRGKGQETAYKQVTTPVLMHWWVISPGKWVKNVGALLPLWFLRIRIYWLGPRHLHIMICDLIMELLNFLVKADGKACPSESECWLGDPGQGCPSLLALASPHPSFIEV